MENKEKKKRIRSPNYPFISLEKSLKYAEIIYQNQKRYAVPMESVAKDWGFSSAITSFMGQHVAALSSFGLIDIEGGKDNKKIKISDLTFNILIDKRPESKERENLTKEAALKPDIFQSIYNTYPNGLPAEHTLEYDLVSKYHFNESSTKKFIGILKETFDFAKVYQSGIIKVKTEPTEEPNMPNIEPSAIESLKGQSQLTTPPPSTLPPCFDREEREVAKYPIGKGLTARIIISGDSRTTVESIEKLIKLLELNKEDLQEIISNENDESSKN